LEWGYRLDAAARGRGYATEASGALIGVSAEEYEGEILGIVRVENAASQSVMRRLGFEHWKRAPVQGETRESFGLELRGWLRAEE
jgi:RimJ/RimL family protein N-acetyltransferase